MAKFNPLPLTPIVILYIICWLTSSISCDDCYQHHFPNGGIACACNKTHCDSLVVDKAAPSGVLVTYTSDITGKRFNKLAVPLSSIPANGTYQSNFIMNIDRSDVRQSINGFGGSFTDAAGINIFSLPETLSKRLLQDYYGADGLEYTMGRVPIGGADFSPRNYSYADIPNDFDLKFFQLAQEDLNYKIPMIKIALNYTNNQIRLVGSLWSSPTWLKTNGQYTGMGIIKGDPGGPYYRTLAKYHVKFLDEYKKSGIYFWGMTSVNEPAGGLKPKWQNPNIGMSPEMIRDWIKTDLGPLLESSGYGRDKLKLIINDEIMSMSLLYTKNILKDPEAAKYVSGVGFHWYEYGYEPYTPMDIIHNAFPEMFLISTEACEGWGGDFQGVRPGNWTRAETYAWDIINILNHWGTGWVDWNLALNMSGGPNYVNNVADSPVLVDAQKSTYYKQPMYYSLGHFSKFLKPGSKRLGFTDNIDHPMLKVTSFLDTSGQIVIIALNRKEETVIATIAGATDSPFQIALPPRSIKTILVPKSSAPPAAPFDSQSSTATPVEVPVASQPQSASEPPAQFVPLHSVQPVTSSSSPPAPAPAPAQPAPQAPHSIPPPIASKLSQH